MRIILPAVFRLLLLPVLEPHPQYDFTIIAETITMTGYDGTGGVIAIPATEL
jgi:hypothetical protein